LHRNRTGTGTSQSDQTRTIGARQTGYWMTSLLRSTSNCLPCPSGYFVRQPGCFYLRCGEGSVRCNLACLIVAQPTGGIANDSQGCSSGGQPLTKYGSDPGGHEVHHFVAQIAVGCLRIESIITGFDLFLNSVLFRSINKEHSAARGRLRTDCSPAKHFLHERVFPGGDESVGGAVSQLPK
jgi:hypothetical protein